MGLKTRISGWSRVWLGGSVWKVERSGEERGRRVAVRSLKRGAVEKKKEGSVSGLILDREWCVSNKRGRSKKKERESSLKILGSGAEKKVTLKFQFWVMSKNCVLCPSCFVGFGAVGIDFGFGREKGGTKNVQKFGILDWNASEMPWLDFRRFARVLFLGGVLVWFGVCSWLWWGGNWGWFGFGQKKRRKPFEQPPSLTNVMVSKRQQR